MGNPEQEAARSKFLKKTWTKEAHYVAGLRNLCKLGFSVVENPRKASLGYKKGYTFSLILAPVFCNGFSYDLSFNISLEAMRSHRSKIQGSTQDRLKLEIKKKRTKTLDTTMRSFRTDSRLTKNFGVLSLVSVFKTFFSFFYKIVLSQQKEF